MNLTVKWQGALSFEARAREHNFLMDAKVEVGGSDKGPTPKELVLAAICACSGMDVSSVLKTMHENLESLYVDGNAETRSEYPQIFKSVHLIYRVNGASLNPEKVIRAVSLSQTKYCGVSAMIARCCDISYEIYLNEELLHKDIAKFPV